MKNKQTLPIHQYLPDASQVVYGCMGLGGGWSNAPVSQSDIAQTQKVIETALANGITLFDHADIYTFGKAEEAFGKCLERSPQLRESMLVQSKCGIRFADEKGPKRYDFSAQWITQSVENILKRLSTEYLDVLLLHRPDPLMEIEETAGALNQLLAQGKIRHIGVSNMHSGQLRWLQQALDAPIVANQIEMSLVQFDWLDESLTTGSAQARDNSFDSHLLTYCQEHKVQLQAWGSLAQGKITDIKRAQTAEHQHVVSLVQDLSDIYQCSAEAIVLAWLMRLPQHIQPIIGTTNTDRIAACAQAMSISLSREHWYALYEAARGHEVP
ncbi:aldo/keto reductase [Alteromonas facilis]|uniref:aldo/keto reductase n=1 Tax=Alteromonas facilis TaxID=2048004 RepID=UPI000C295662|nr:aldo/keto reductase [Alteromonas facilis]